MNEPIPPGAKRFADSPQPARGSGSGSPSESNLWQTTPHASYNGAMTITVEGIYENGQLKLKEPLELADGTAVRVAVTPVQGPPAEATTNRPSVVEFLASLPPGPRSYATWEEFEKSFQQERDAWER